MEQKLKSTLKVNKKSLSLKINVKTLEALQMFANENNVTQTSVIEMGILLVLGGASAE